MSNENGTADAMTIHQAVDDGAASSGSLTPLCPGEGGVAGAKTAQGLEQRVAFWVETRIGRDHMQPRERAMRNLEESIELAQAEGFTLDQVKSQAVHVFGRPAGEPAQEAAGVAVTLLAWCAARGHTLMGLALAEIERIEAKSLEEIRGSLARKADADLVTCVQYACNNVMCALIGMHTNACVSRRADRGAR